MVLLYYAVEKVFNFIFRKEQKQIDPSYFFTKEFGFKLFVVNLFFALIGGCIGWYSLTINNEIFGYIGLGILIVFGYMAWRGILKMLVFGAHDVVKSVKKK